MFQNNYNTIVNQNCYVSFHLHNVVDFEVEEQLFKQLKNDVVINKHVIDKMKIVNMLTCSDNINEDEDEIEFHVVVDMTINNREYQVRLEFVISYLEMISNLDLLSCQNNQDALLYISDSLKLYLEE